MKGTNVIVLSKETMIEIAQAWVETAFAEGHRQHVTSVEKNTDLRYSNGDFIVTVSDKPWEPA